MKNKKNIAAIYLEFLLGIRSSNDKQQAILLDNDILNFHQKNTF